MPKVSVIMPVYNSEKYLAEAIESILSQTFSDFEFIIIDDCSTDSSYQIADSFRDSRIRLFRNSENSGVAYSLNRGIELSEGYYIARMDADDISLLQRLERQISYLETHPSVGVLGTAISFCGAKQGIFQNTDSPQQAKIDLLFNSCICHPTAIIRRSSLDKFRYDRNFEGCEDYELWWRLSFRCEITSLSEVLFHYRFHKSQVTQNVSENVRNRFRTLKLNQIRDIGINANSAMIDSFIAYCSGNSLSISQTRALFDCLACITEKNRCSHFYEQKLLKNTFANIEKSRICQASRKSYFDLLKHSRHCSKLSCIFTSIKNSFL